MHEIIPSELSDIGLSHSSVNRSDIVLNTKIVTETPQVNFRISDGEKGCIPHSSINVSRFHHHLIFSMSITSLKELVVNSFWHMRS